MREFTHDAFVAPAAVTRAHGNCGLGKPVKALYFPLIP